MVLLRARDEVEEIAALGFELGRSIEAQLAGMLRQADQEFGRPLNGEEAAIVGGQADPELGFGATQVGF